MLSEVTLIDPEVQQTNLTKDTHILIALDESENSKRALLYVADLLGGQPGIRATMLSIVSDASVDYFENDYEFAEWLEHRYGRIKEMLDIYGHIMTQSGFLKDKINRRIILNYCTSVSECILKEQKSLGCCTIVVGRRVLTRKEEFLFGSTSTNILRAPKNCAVWVVE